MVVGFAQLSAMSVDVLPEFSPTTVEVQTEALGLSAEEVEQLITVPLEQDLLVGIPFLDDIESVSLPGLSSVVMTFERGTTLLDARQVVQERLTQAVGVAGLPEVAKLPQMIQPVSSNRRVSMIKLSSKTMTPIDVSVLARWVISPRLMGVPGVANVTVWGLRDRQLQVLVDPQRLQQTNTTLAQVIKTAGNALEVSPLTFLEASSPGTGGFIETVNQRLNIFHEQVIKTAKELAQVPLEPSDGGANAAAGSGTPGRTLGEVATVVEDHQPLIGDAICSDGEECLFLVIEKLPGANTLEVTTEVESALSGMRPGLGDLRIDSSLYRPASYIESSFRHLAIVLAIGVVLALIAVGFLLGGWRRILIVAIVTPLSMAAALLVLSLRGTTLNPMIIAGLVLGVTTLIYDAIIDTHALSHRLRESREAGVSPRPLEIVVKAAGGVRGGVLAGLLVGAVAIVPFFFLWGEGEAFLPPILLSYLLAVAASTLIALTVTPVLGLLLLGNAPQQRSESRLMGWVRRGYERVLPSLVTRGRAAVAVAAVLAVVGLVGGAFLSVSTRPALKERDVLVEIEAPPGTSLPKMTEITRRAVKDLRAIRGVADAGGQVGRAITSDQIVNVNAGEVWVKIGSGADYARTVASIKETVLRYPGVSSDVLTYSEERVDDVLGGEDDDAVVRVYGEDMTVLRAKADEVREVMAGVDGVARVTVERALEEPTVEVAVDLNRALAAGVKPGDVRRAAATLLGGITVGNLFDQQKVFDVVVWGTPQIRESERNIEQLLIDTPGGGRVRIGDVADVRVRPNPTLIRHESVAPFIDVTADVSGRSIGAVTADIERRLGQMTFPLEYHAEVVGEYQERLDDWVQFTGVMIAAVLAIFLLLHATFWSWRLAVLAFLTLPLAAVGGVVALLFAGRTLELGSLAGLLAVLGIAAREVALLLRRYQELQEEGVVSGRELALRGARDRAVPSLILTVTIAAIFAPIALAGNIAGLEILHSMSLVVLGGLVTTLLLTTFLLPALYLRWGVSGTRDTSTDDLLLPAPGAASDREARHGWMHRMRPATAMVPILSLLALTACGGTIVDTYTIQQEPAHLEPIEGSDRVRVVVTEQAARRLAMKTAPIQASSRGTLVPTSATFVDPDGVWWVYTNPEPQVFVRERIEIAQEAGDLTYISSGPAPGTEVATVGVAELYGVENEVGH
jgi:Cu/Ag efflux pump CusA